MDRDNNDRESNPERTQCNSALEEAVQNAHHEGSQSGRLKRMILKTKHICEKVLTSLYYLAKEVFILWPRRSAARESLANLQIKRPEDYDLVVEEYQRIGARIAEEYGFSKFFVAELKRSLSADLKCPLP